MIVYLMMPLIALSHQKQIGADLTEPGEDFVFVPGYIPPETPTDPASEEYLKRTRSMRGNIPEYYNAIELGLVSTQSKNQGVCGSCVAFASTVVLEACYKRVTGQWLDFSEQYLLDCGYRRYRANGCTGAAAASYLLFTQFDQPRPILQYQYPYQLKGGKPRDYQYTCPNSLVPINYGVAITEVVATAEATEKDIMAAVAQHGAVVGILFANTESFNNYRANDGIYAGCEPGETRKDHAVAIIGYGTENGEDYWLIKNSWGSWWGDNNLMKIKRGVNMCNIETEFAMVNCESGSP